MKKLCIFLMMIILLAGISSCRKQDKNIFYCSETPLPESVDGSPQSEKIAATKGAEETDGGEVCLATLQPEEVKEKMTETSENEPANTPRVSEPQTAFATENVTAVAAATADSGTDATATPGETTTEMPYISTETPCISASPTQAVTQQPVTTQPVFTIKSTEAASPEATQSPSEKYKEEKKGDIIIRTDITYEYTTPEEKQVEVGEEKTVSVVPDRTLGYYYSLRTSVLPEIAEDYLKNQTASNSLSHLSDTSRILGFDYLEGTPFYYLPLEMTELARYGAPERIIIDYNDSDGNGVLCSVWTKPGKLSGEVAGVDKTKEYPCMVYLSGKEIIGGVLSEEISERHVLMTENHLGITVTRPVRASKTNDYTFLAYPLANGKYVINCGGGIILLEKAPESRVDIRFSAGGGVAGFRNFQLAVDGCVIYEAELFCVNSYSGDCRVYG